MSEKPPEPDGADANHNALYEGLLEIANALRDIADALREEPVGAPCDCDLSHDDMTTH